MSAPNKLCTSTEEAASAADDARVLISKPRGAMPRRVVGHLSPAQLMPDRSSHPVALSASLMVSLSTAKVYCVSDRKGHKCRPPKPTSEE